MSLNVSNSNSKVKAFNLTSFISIQLAILFLGASVGCWIVTIIRWDELNTNNSIMLFKTFAIVFTALMVVAIVISLIFFWLFMKAKDKSEESAIKLSTNRTDVNATKPVVNKPAVNPTTNKPNVVTPVQSVNRPTTNVNAVKPATTINPVNRPTTTTPVNRVVQPVNRPIGSTPTAVRPAGVNPIRPTTSTPINRPAQPVNRPIGTTPTVARPTGATITNRPVGSTPTPTARPAQPVNRPINPTNKPT